MKRIFVTILMLLMILMPAAQAAAQENTVHAVLFYSPTCPHCHQVITVNLPEISAQSNTSVAWGYFGEDYDPASDEAPPLVALMGDALTVLYVETTTEIGNELFGAAIERYNVPSESWVVPFMVIDDTYYTGSIDIPEQLSLYIRQAQETGGIEWPDIPGLQMYVDSLQLFPDQTPTEAESSPTSSPAPGSSSPNSQPTAPEAIDPAGVLARNPADLSIGERIMLDPEGNAFAIAVLIGMLFSIVTVGLRWSSRFAPGSAEPASIWIPVLAVIGMGIAGYLAYIAASGSEAVCGPVGDCNTVAQSEYSTLLFGLSNGAVGAAGYLLILASWIAARTTRSPISEWALLGLFAAALIGTLFSLYLTFLEPFVIGASCAWCLTSAILITAVMLLAAGPARAANARVRSAD